MKGDIYYLIDPRGYVIGKFEQTDNYMTGYCYSNWAWEADDKKTGCGWSFFADVYCKWSGCTHWYFNGEDYSHEFVDDVDAYYHICGNQCFLQHVRLMCFIWKLAEEILVESYENDAHNIAEYTRQEYSGNKELKRLVDFMLDGYTIKKGGKDEKNNGYHFSIDCNLFPKWM